jgi:hypothetical protein
VKVAFQLDPGAWHGSGTETLWAERVGERQFRLRNVPFFVFGVGVDDVIFAREAGGIFELESVSIHGGHSTYRIIAGATISSEQINSKWQELEELGCTYEQGPGASELLMFLRRQTSTRCMRCLRKASGEDSGTSRKATVAML